MRYLTISWYTISVIVSVHILSGKTITAKMRYNDIGLLISFGASKYPANLPAHDNIIRISLGSNFNIIVRWKVYWLTYLGDNYHAFPCISRLHV